ncbi:cysteine-rich receptor-like protein kinase 8 [Tanacetum coccineum]
MLPKPLGLAEFSTHSYTPQQTNFNNTNRNANLQYLNRPQTGRKSTFKPGVYCTNCSKEGHYVEECYKLKGYPIGHPLHGKYKPPMARSVNMNDSKNAKVNFVQGQDTGSTSNQAEASTSGTDVVFVRMYQLQNQLNQVMLMMQQCQKDPPTGMVNSYTIRKHVRYAYKVSFGNRGVRDGSVLKKGRDLSVDFARNLFRSASFSARLCVSFSVRGDYRSARTLVFLRFTRIPSEVTI